MALACGPPQGAARHSAAELLESVSPTGKEDDPNRWGPPVGGREEREEGAEMGRKQEELGRREENWAGLGCGKEERERKSDLSWAKRKKGKGDGFCIFFCKSSKQVQFKF